MVSGSDAGFEARGRNRAPAGSGAGAGRAILAALLAAAALVWLGQARAQSLQASVDRSEVGQGDTVELVLSYPGQNPAGEPDLSPLEQDFQVLGTGRSSRVNIINGRMDASTDWHVQLMPKHNGTLTIPSIALGSAHSRPITIKVAQGRSGQSGGTSGNVFLETSLDPKSPYVQGQLVYTVRIFHAVQLRNASLSDPKAEDAIIQRLGDDVSYQTEHDGRSYQVIERRYAIFPQHSGALTVEAPVLSAEVLDRHRRSTGIDELFNGFPGGGVDPFGSLFAATRPVRASAPSASVTVRARPAGSGSGPWLPAQNLSVSEAWSPDPPKFRVGEPVTRTVTLLARGLTAAQLPDVDLGAGGDIKVYPDQPALQTTTQANIVLGKRVMKAALVPARAGRLTLPEVRIPWWDADTDQPKVAVLPPRNIDVLPAAGQPAVPPTPAPQHAVQSTPAAPIRSAESPSPAAVARPHAPPVPAPGWWPWLSVALAAGWLLTLGLWAWEHRRRRRTRALIPPPPPALRPAERELRTACASADAARARTALLAWGAARWPARPPRSLGALSRQLGDPQAAAAVQALDRLLYAGSPRSWTGGAELLQALRPVLRGAGRSEAKRESPLPELYANA